MIQFSAQLFENSNLKELVSALGEPLGQIHGEKEELYFKLI